MLASAAVEDELGPPLGTGMPAAILGNGSLLATVSATGRMERLFWPHVDRDQHLGELRLAAIADGGGVTWLDAGGLEHVQRYHSDANVLSTRIAGRGSPSIEITDLVTVDEPVLLRRVQVGGGGGRIAVYCRPELDESARYGGVYIDAARRALVFHRRDRALAIALAPAESLGCGRSGGDGSRSALRALEPGGDGCLGAIEFGTVDGLALGAGAREHVIACAFAGTPERALARAERALADGFERALAVRGRRDGALLEDADGVRARSPRLAALCRRSLLTLDLLTDRETGGIIAAPEFDRDFQHCGGYGYVWARDLAYVALALLATGRRKPAVAALLWLTRTQSAAGLWLHRHWTDGTLAPSWGLHQVDETGAALFAFEAAWHELGDERLDRELWRSARRGADFLCGFIDPVLGLPIASVDLWEERAGRHAYSAAAVCAGLRSAASMARRHAPELAGHYRSAAERVRAAIEAELWSARHGRYVRALRAGPIDGALLPIAAFQGAGASPCSPVREGMATDELLDISLLGLAWPFRVVDPSSARMRSTIAAVERALGVEDGGMLRYEGDTYAGGNSWILAVLWLGLVHRQLGEPERHRASIEYALARAGELGLLPEQVRPDGRPAWVMPLGWSHAMLLLATSGELGIVEAPERIA